MRRMFFMALVAAVSVLAMGGTATSAVPQVSCQLFQAGESPSSTLDVNWASRLYHVVPQTESGVSGAATLGGYPGWAVFLDNHTAGTVTNPTVTLSSGLDPAVFDGQIPAFPYSCSLPKLDPNQELQIFSGLEATGLHSSFSLGYDSSRSVSPTEVPVGGGDVTVQFSVKLTDARYAGGAFVFLHIDQGNDVSIVSESSPANLDQGESASPPPNAVQNPSSNDGVFALSNAQLGKTYVFSAVVHVDNVLGEVGGGRFTWVPGAEIFVSGQGQGCTLACNASGSSVSFADPSFGSVGLSVDQSDRNWSVNTNTQYVTLYRGGLFPDVYAQESSSIGAGLPPTVDSIASGTTLQGRRNWQFSIGMGAGLPQSENPTVSVLGGYDPSLLNPGWGPPATGYPIVFSGSDGNSMGSSVNASFSTPCDMSRSVSPLTVPAGGGQQTITLTIACSGIERINGGLGIDMPGAQVLSFTPPGNLTTEELFAPTSFPQAGGSGFGLQNVISGKQYTLSWVVQVPNTGSSALVDKPELNAAVAYPLPTGCRGCTGARTSVTVAEPTLDGPTPGGGQITFSTTNPHVWNVGVFTGYEIALNGIAVSSDQCKNGGWRGYGIFKNQGDCISYVATGGKNPPAGG